MPTMTQVRGVDLAAWQEGRVPPDVVRACRFIYEHKKCSWAEIAAHMGWDDLPREEWRAKMKRLRRWGVMWAINKPGSTRIHGDVKPFLA